VPPPKEWKTRKPCRDEQLSGGELAGEIYRSKHCIHTCYVAHTLNNFIHHLFPNCVVAPSVCIALAPLMHLYLHRHTVVGSILLATDQLFGVKELSIGAGADLVNWLCDSE